MCGSCLTRHLSLYTCALQVNLVAFRRQQSRFVWFTHAPLVPALVCWSNSSRPRGAGATPHVRRVLDGITHDMSLVAGRG